MRLFVGVALSETVKAAVAAFAAELRRRAAARAPRARIAWVQPEQLHVTIRFIGEVDDARAASIGTALAAPLAVNRFTMEVDGVGTFPPNGAPRVLWVGIASGADGLMALERDVSDRLAACGVGREERRYNPHVTIARVRDAAGLRASTMLAGTGARRFGRMSVEAITLFQSRTSPSGATYVPICRTSLP